jgi:CubicO group peptidase (beta-lactamase class C family)
MPSKSQAGLAGLHQVMAGYVKRREMPGLVTLLSRRGEVWVDAIGAKAFGGDPVARDTIFRIASMTKPITAAAAMILIEDHKLELNEPVDRLLPELAHRKVLRRLEAPLDDTVPAKRSITVRDLLTFCMGFGQIVASPVAYPILEAADELEIGMGGPEPSVTPPPEEWIRRLGSLPLMYQPGEKWMYHTSADVLGVLIARASGNSFESFLRERLFEPLAMHDTGFSVPAAKVDRFATSYWTHFKTGALAIFDEAPGGQWSRPPAFPSGGAGLVSTIDDYRAFGEMLLNHGWHRGERILSRASIELMTSDQLSAEQKADAGLVPGFFTDHGWGFGMSVVTQGDRKGESVGAFGWDGGLGTSWRADPRSGLVGILMTQKMWTSPNPPQVCRDFWTLAYQAIAGEGPLFPARGGR